jgi:biopolymer transport protein ExbB
LADYLSRIVTVLVCWCATSGVALAQAEEQAPGSEHSLMRIIFSGGPLGIAIMCVLILLSISGMALVIEHALSIRRSVLIPEGLEQQLTQSLAQGQVGQAINQCEANPSCLASLVSSSLAEVEGGWPAVEKALDEEAAEQAGRLYRKIEYLALLGNIAPMLGLLGTVVGMIIAFREVADTQGAARAGQLASGIYQALVTTVSGLMIAIPSVAIYAVFRNRVDALMAESMATSRKILTPVKRALTLRKQGAPPRPPGPPA